MNIKSRILLIEDEESLAKGLEYNLILEGYVVDWAKDGRKGIEMFHDEDYDLIILDIMLPYMNGFEVAKNVRENNPQMPILMLTARASDKDKVNGLEHGADDYMTKPFNLDELLLRIKGMIKRKNWYKSVSKLKPVLAFGNIIINFEKLILKKDDKEILLTQIEAMVLQYFIERTNQVVTRSELLKNVWHTNPEVETRTVDNFIVRLRKYIEDDSTNPVYIKSVRGEGYIFTTE